MQEQLQQRGGDDEEALHDKIANLETALASRDVIGQAKGILMERMRITADEAFATLVEHSQAGNIRVVEVSRVLARTGQWPPRMHAA